MNLYWVEEKDAEWGVFVFAKTRNKARSMLPDYEDEVWYVNTRAKLIGKTEEVTQETLVDWYLHPLYPLVQKLGGKFADPESEEE